MSISLFFLYLIPRFFLSVDAECFWTGQVNYVVLWSFSHG